MAVAATPTTIQELLVRAVTERLSALDSEAPGEVFGAGYARFAGYSAPFEIQRIDLDEVVPVGDQVVALLYQRGRDTGGSWSERRLSAVYAHAGAGPRLYPSWVAGLDAASRW